MQLASRCLSMFTGDSRSVDKPLNLQEEINFVTRRAQFSGYRGRGFAETLQVQCMRPAR
jgi:hypothetical protein